MGRLTARSPATIDDCLVMGGWRPLARKVMIWQREIGDSISFLDGDDLVALAFLVRNGDGETEFALALRAGARARMLELCRIAHLTLSRLAETGPVIICHVSPGNRSGARMARLVGFSHDAGTRWKWSGRDAGNLGTVRGRKLGREEGGGEEPPAPAGGE